MNSKQDEIKRIKKLSIMLKDMESYVKNPDFLMQGRRFSNFNMLIREAWANWILCAVFSWQYNEDFTFQEDLNGDGIIINRNTEEYCIVEHVCALDFPVGEQPPKNEERILWAISHKTKKGSEYARGKSLVVFFEGAELWYPKRVARMILWKHDFKTIYCVGLVVNNKDGYLYSVSEIGSLCSPTWLVKINPEFTSWLVQRIQ